MSDSLETQVAIKPDQILEIAIRRKWFIIIPLCLSLTLGLIHTLTANKTYEASTLILVQPQRVPTNYVRSVVTSTISQRISTISQQILSRSNLEKIIDQFGLFENSEGMYLEDKISSMRKRVKVKIEKARHGAEAFSIVFKGSEPQRVMRVANTLASYFMDENLKVREAQAVGTSEFLDSELEKTRKRLEDRERQLAEYRKKHLGGLPDELESNLRTLDRLQKQISGEQELLQQARTSLSVLETQIAQSNEMASQVFEDEFSFEDDGEESEEQSEDEEKLEVAQKMYESLLLVYTEKHPDVAKVKKTIEKLEKAIEEASIEAEKAMEEELAMEDETELSEEENKKPETQNFAVMQQKAQLKTAKAEIAKIQSNIKKLQENMKLYQKRVEDTPKRELELQSLQRDYANIQEIYNSLLDRKLEAELSVNMEKKQKGEQFRILDHARLPEKPISPNVKVLFLFSIAAGLGAGVGVIFLMEFFDTSIRREEQIENQLGLKILASVPVIKQEQDKAKKRIEWIVFACFSLYAALFFFFFSILTYKGLDRTIAAIKSTLSM